jgi:hypothetical protein
MKKSLIAICVIGAVLVVFQNCSDKSFSARTDLNKSLSLDGSEQLVEDDIPNEIEDDVVNNDDDSNNDDGGGSTMGGTTTGGSSGGSSTGGSSSSGGSTTAGSSDDDVVAENDDDDPRGNSTGGNSTGGSSMGGSTTASSSGDDDDSNVNDSGRHVCILAGPGKSRHVAVINDQIVSQNSTPKTACMSRNACENIVGAKLDVKSVESRGYCKNGTPQVLVFTDAQIQVLVDKIQ